LPLGLGDGFITLGFGGAMAAALAYYLGTFPEIEAPLQGEGS
jgi:hypothetical protein